MIKTEVIKKLNIQGMKMIGQLIPRFFIWKIGQESSNGGFYSFISSQVCLLW